MCILRWAFYRFIAQAEREWRWDEDPLYDEDLVS